MIDKKPRVTAHAKPEDLRVAARALGCDGPCPCCDLSTGYICEACNGANQLLLAARTIEHLTKRRNEIDDEAYAYSESIAQLENQLADAQHEADGYREKADRMEAKLRDLADFCGGTLVTAARCALRNMEAFGTDRYERDQLQSALSTYDRMNNP